MSEYACDKCGTEVPNGSGHYPNGDTGDRVCRECANEKYYLIWEDTAEGYHTASTLPQGVKLTTTNDGTTGYVVDISHWDSGDFYAFDSSHPDDKIAQLEGLVEHQTQVGGLDTNSIPCDTL